MVKIAEGVCVRIDGEVVCMLRKHTIVLTDTDKGRLLDEREVSKIGDKWYYTPQCPDDNLQARGDD